MPDPNHMQKFRQSVSKRRVKFVVPPREKGLVTNALATPEPKAQKAQQFTSMRIVHVEKFLTFRNLSIYYVPIFQII